MNCGHRENRQTPMRVQAETNRIRDYYVKLQAPENCFLKIIQ